MTLMAQAKMTEDNGLIIRVAASAGSLGVQEARAWAVSHMWLVAATPGWGDVYAAAMEGDPELPDAEWYGIHGKDPLIITDAMIRARVEEIIIAESE